MRSPRFFSVGIILFAILTWTFSFVPAVHGQEETPSPTATIENAETETPALEPPATSAPDGAPAELPTSTSTPVALGPSPTTTSSDSVRPEPDNQNANSRDVSTLYVNDEVLIRFNSLHAKERSDEDVQKLGGRQIGEIPELGVIQLQIPLGTVESFIEAMRNKSGVVYVEPNYYLDALDTIPNDTSYGLQYGLPAIRAPQGWDISTGSAGVIIAIVDSGVDLNHPDLAAKIVGGVLGKGKDFVNSDDIAQDDYGHGTHVAGIAAASSNNGAGVSGVSWGAKIMPVKVLNSSGSGTIMNISLGIDWAADNGAQVINLSLGGNPSFILPANLTTLQNAINYASTKGVTIVAASGNSNGPVFVPAAFPNVIAVGATDNTNTRYSLSNFGPELDVMAPGVNIYSTYLPNTYTNDTGTSMSAPFVSGAAAILRGYISSPSAIQAQLQNTALDLGAPGYDNLYGYGLIQLDKALISSVPLPSPVSASNSNAGGWSPFYQPFVMLTFSPTPTSITPTFTVSQTETITQTLTETLITTSNETTTPTITPTEIFAPQAQSGSNSWWLPCLGILCLLAGLLLFFWMRRDRNRKSFFISPRKY